MAPAVPSFPWPTTGRAFPSTSARACSSTLTGSRAAPYSGQWARSEPARGRSQSRRRSYRDARQSWPRIPPLVSIVSVRTMTGLPANESDSFAAAGRAARGPVLFVATFALMYGRFCRWGSHYRGLKAHVLGFLGIAPDPGLDPRAFQARRRPRMPVPGNAKPRPPAGTPSLLV